MDMNVLFIYYRNAKKELAVSDSMFNVFCIFYMLMFYLSIAAGQQ